MHESPSWTDKGKPWPRMGWMGHDLGMKSRVHPKYKTKYRVTNWAAYDRALVQRGDFTLWISEDAIASWKPAPTGLRGAQRKFSDHAIETALVLRLVFKLPLRQAEGFLRSVLSLMSVDLEAPDHTTLSRRSQDLNVDLHRAAVDNPIHLIVDSTGLSSPSPSGEHLLQIQDDYWRKTSGSPSEVSGELWPIRPQFVEALMACNILNRMTTIERPDSFAIASQLR